MKRMFIASLDRDEHVLADPDGSQRLGGTGTSASRRPS